MNLGNQSHDIREKPVFSAELRPYRSLGRQGMKILVVITLAIAVFHILFFSVSGAWPVAMFLGLDIALLYGAFYLNYRAARMREVIALTRTEISVRKYSAAGVMKEWRDNPFWLRFDISRHDEYGITAMRLIGRNGLTDVGSFLNPDDREKFAKALSLALASVRRRI